MNFKFLISKICSKLRLKISFANRAEYAMAAAAYLLKSRDC
jgi:hypothetical protein